MTPYSYNDLAPKSILYCKVVQYCMYTRGITIQTSIIIVVTSWIKRRAVRRAKQHGRVYKVLYCSTVLIDSTALPLVISRH